MTGAASPRFPRPIGGGRQGRSPIAPTAIEPLPAAIRPAPRSTRPRGIDAATGLTIYVVLLLVIPSSVTIRALGSYGRFALLWGLVLLVWWLLTHLQYRVAERSVVQPVRHAIGLFAVIVLVSFAAAMFRGQPTDQISSAISAVVRVGSWAGVALVAIDGIRTIDDMRSLFRRLAIAGGILAALGLLQSITRETYLTWFSLIPGLVDSSQGIGDRGNFARATGTATHPLEFAVAIVGLLPIALGAAATRGFRDDAARPRPLWWIGPILILVTSLVAISRSAIIGLVIAVLGSMIFLPRRYRWGIIAVGGAALVAITLLVPRLFTTLIYLFTGASNDSSTLSRTDALARVPGYLSVSPIFGVGFGTFLPRYYIFDNQFVLLLIELGILGVIAFSSIVLAALWSTIRAGQISHRPETIRFSRILAASLVSIVVLFAFFDALSFPIAAGLFFLVIGLCASIRTVAQTDAMLVVADDIQTPPRPRPLRNRWPRLRRMSTRQAEERLTPSAAKNATRSVRSPSRW